MVSLKNTAKVKNITAGLAWILYALEEFDRLYEGNKPPILLVTSVNDSVHSINSRHYRDEAIDIRSKTFKTQVDKIKFRQEFEKYLNNHPILKRYDPERVGKFRVLYESEGTDNEHFHVQIKKGASFP